jgi:molecular chaperone GrpE
MKDQLLRTVAEMENLRRRTEKEVRDAKQFSVASFARDMLGVADNLRRGQEAIADEDRVAAEGALKALLDGTAMTEREMLKTLEKHGVKKLNPQGEKFDPNYHQAMFEVPNPEVPNNSVIQVVQAGYVIGTRVLRPAMVGVAKGGPKFVAPTEEAGEASEGIDKSV